MSEEKRNVTLVTKAACPVCMMVKGELDKHLGTITVRCLKNTDPEGREIIRESGLHSAPIISCDGKFYAGKDALTFAVGL